MDFLGLPMDLLGGPDLRRSPRFPAVIPMQMLTRQPESHFGGE